jgi:hypothetical protein
MKTARYLGTIAAVACLVAAASTPAMASAGASDVSVGTIKTTAPMNVVGFDEGVANANGYTIVRDEDGTAIASVPNGTAIPDNPTESSIASLVEPQDVREGSCGESYFWLTPTGGTGHKAYVSTGFDVILSVSAYTWKTSYLDGYGASTKIWTGGGIGNSGDFGFIYTAGGATTIYGWVDIASFTVLTNGAVCHSAGPTDSQAV